MISIIIPIYNTERYLSECLDSIISQTYKNWECILVDDGSKDNSPKICDEYVNKDSRFSVIHKANAGVSAARNDGLNKAQGEWITFVDSDDYLRPLFLEHLLKHQEADIVWNGTQFFSGNDEKVQYNDCIASEAESIGLALKRNMFHWAFGTPWGKLYRHSIIEMNNLRFDVKMFFREDEVFLFQYLLYCNKVCFTSYTDYCYRWSSTNKHPWSLNDEQLPYHYHQIENAYRQLTNKYHFHSEDKEEHIANLLVCYFNYQSTCKWQLLGGGKYIL